MRHEKLPPVWSIAFKPNGSQMIVGVGNRVLVYDAEEFTLIKGRMVFLFYKYNRTVVILGFFWILRAPRRIGAILPGPYPPGPPGAPA